MVYANALCRERETMKGKTMPKHTPTPWINKGIITYHLTDDSCGVVEYEGGYLEIYGQDMGENAAFIVRAVNSHDGLIAALREAQAVLSVFPNIDSLYSRINAALKLTETGE